MKSLRQFLKGVESLDEEKTRTTINIDKKLWAKIRLEAYETGETVSQVVERRLREIYEKRGKGDTGEGGMSEKS